VVTHQLQVERRTVKVRRPKTDVLPLCHATNRSEGEPTVTDTLQAEGSATLFIRLRKRRNSRYKPSQELK